MLASRADGLIRSTNASSVRRLAYLFLLLALMPLAWNTFFSGDVDLLHELELTIEHHPEIQAKFEGAESLDEVLTVTLESVPDHKLDSALLSHDTYTHWAFAGMSSAVFTVLILVIFPRAATSIPRLLGVGLFTATIGILLLLGVQWAAEISQGVGIRGGGKVALLLLIVKLIGMSYHMALDPESNVILSALGFTFGVGMCEEICKALPIFVHYQSKADWGWRTACVVGLISGVGFGVSEGITYSSDYYNGLLGGEIYLVRFVSCVALHAVWSGASGIFIWRQQANLQSAEGFFFKFFWWITLVAVPMTLHGFYDTLLKKDMPGWALLTAFLSFGWLILQIEWARKTDPDDVPAESRGTWQTA